MKTFVFFLLLLNLSCDQNDSKSKPVLIDSLNNSDPKPITELPPVTVVADITKTQEFMNLINNHRTSLGLQPLIHVDELGAIAAFHSTEMAEGLVSFGHTGFSDRCSEARVVVGGGNLCAENVAMGQKTVTAAFNAWMNSPGHRANIEQSRVTHTGFGFKQSSSGSYYWTQIFIEKN